MPPKAVTRKPERLEKPKRREAAAAAIVRGGGSVAGAEAPPVSTRETHTMNLRMPDTMVAEMDALLGRRIGKVSRNTWILEAIAEKIEQET